MTATQYIELTVGGGKLGNEKRWHLGSVEPTDGTWDLSFLLLLFFFSVIIFFTFFFSLQDYYTTLAYESVALLF